MLLPALIIPLILAAGCENNSGSGDAVNEDVPEFRIDPASVSMGVADTNTVAVFEVIGGQGPFTWTVSDTTIGTLSGADSGGRFVNYTRTGTAEGANSIEVRDSNAWTAHAVVMQDND